MYYQKHILFCVNQRGNDKPCCNNANAQASFKYFKKRLKDLGLKGKEHCHVSSSSCLGRCSEGPIIVIYPDAVWYTYNNSDDLEQIIHDHLIHDTIVSRLLLTGSATRGSEQ